MLTRVAFVLLVVILSGIVAAMSATSPEPGTADVPRLRTLVPDGSDGTALGTGVVGDGAVDAEMATGPDSLLIVTNDGVRLMEKNGTTEIDSAALDGGVFTTESTWTQSGIVDPDVFFDQRSQRFFMVAVERGVCNFNCFMTGCTTACGGQCPSAWCEMIENRLHIAMSTSDDPSDLDMSGSEWDMIHLNIQDSGHADAFEGLAHSLNIACDADNLFIAVTDSPTLVRTSWRTVVVIVPKCMIAGNCSSEMDWSYVRIEESGYNTWGHALGVEYTDDSDTGPMYLVALYDFPQSEFTGEQTKLRIAAIYEGNTGWT